MPIITGLANRFANFVANNRQEIIDFGEKFLQVMAGIAEKGAYAIAILVDSWRGLQMTWQVLKIGLLEWEQFYLTVLEKFTGAVVTVMEKLNFSGVFDSAIEKAQGFQGALENLNAVAEEQATETWANLNDIISQGMAVEKVQEFTEAIKEAIADGKIATIEYQYGLGVERQQQIVQMRMVTPGH